MMTMPPEASPESAGALYWPTGVTPEQIFEVIGRLRKEARDEIDRLIGFIDKTDDYVSRELEDDDSANFEDGGDSEPSLGSLDRMTDQTKLYAGGPTDHFSIDRELDKSDDEPSLGSLAMWEYNTQELWAAGTSNNCEDEHDGAEPNEDGEPSLGSLDGQLTQEQWAAGGGYSIDAEADPAESGIADNDGLQEQMGRQDSQTGVFG
jgi:hypothetical protein